MAKLIEHEIQKGSYWFECLGCKDTHLVNTVANSYNGSKWEFNGDLNRPTFSPSILVNSGHFADPNTDSCWCTYNQDLIERGEEPSTFECKICHSFIRDGKIQYLNDCTHELAGQTVEMIDISNESNI